MDRPTTIDHEARAELLCYLVVAQLMARTHTGEWLRVDHFVGSLNIWLRANRADADWLERMQSKSLSEMVAIDFGKLPQVADAGQLAELFADGWRLEYRSPVVRSI